MWNRFQVARRSIPCLTPSIVCIGLLLILPFEVTKNAKTPHLLATLHKSATRQLLRFHDCLPSSVFFLLVVYNKKPLPVPAKSGEVAFLERDYLPMPSVPHRSEAVEYSHRGLAVECGSVEILLTLLRHSATILLMQVERTVPQHGSWLAQRAIHLTARKMEQRDSPIYYCTIPAVQFLFVGDHGQLIAPVREERATTQVTARALAVATSLQEALVASLQ